jgi:hypothetical protein
MSDKEDKTDEDDVRKGDWVWCLHCERCYQVGESRKKHGLELCPYPDCDGDTFLDKWTWKHIRQIHPDYPEIPERGKIYPLY